MNIKENICNVFFAVYFCCIQTCLGGLNGLPETRAFGSKERGESGVLPVRDLNTLAAGRPLTNLQQRATQLSLVASFNQRKCKLAIHESQVVKYSCVYASHGIKT
jgi:hypothetical protein